jgi:preprotein translocase subunit SecE
MATPVAPVRQESIPKRLTTFYTNVMSEMRKVTWPDRAQLQDSTIKIIIFVLALGAVIGLLDLALQFVLVQLPALLLGR